ncbi:MAG TPA: outer membrane beta-barrel protein [Devosiaceae bacterium]|nr:outer membrane beta-barrel protein [Devosiaceae bacterium]
MRFIAGVLVTVAALVAGPALAADLPQYAPPSPPPVDTGLGGNFYLRGSAGLNGLWTSGVDYHCGCLSDGTAGQTQAGFGYSLGVGVGYETGTGLRADLTVDYLSNDHLTAHAGSGGTQYNLDASLRSTLVLANAYYDFGLGSLGLDNGGLGAYVGAGIGGAFNQVSDNTASPAPSGTSATPAAAVMAGLTYDMGAVVADVGYRGIYMPSISNESLDEPFYIRNAWINEVRTTLRYRFN